MHLIDYLAFLLTPNGFTNVFYLVQRYTNTNTQIVNVGEVLLDTCDNRQYARVSMHEHLPVVS